MAASQVDENEEESAKEISKIGKDVDGLEKKIAEIELEVEGIEKVSMSIWPGASTL